MSANVGQIDRALRALLGLILIAAPFAYTSEIWANPYVKYGVLVAGAVMLFTAAMKFCPLYTIFGIRTCKTR